MKKFIGLFIVCLGWVTSVQAQNFEEEFNAFMNQNQQQFNNFIDSINRQFAETMAANMKAFTGEQPMVRDSKPKPDKLPEIKKDNVPELPVVKPQLPPQESPDKPVEDKPSSFPAEQLNFLDFNLFGENIHLIKKPFPSGLKGITVDDVSDFWIQLSECDCEEMLQRCHIARQQQAFNDWAVYQLVLRMAQQTYDHQFNEQVVMTVFLLNQLGMEAKVGFAQTHLFCLIAIEQQLYGISFVDIAGKRYYVFELDPYYNHIKSSKAFRTYDIPFPESTHSLDMNLPRPLKSMETTNAEKEIHINLSMIELFKTYPQVEMSVYANATPSKLFCESIEQAFKPYLKTQSTYDAVSFLLAYLQYGFDYATDDDQFGFEKPFFCEENYYYPYNDCEDRSVLFSFLVRHLLHLDVVLIDYPGHVAAAVHFPTEVKGEYVQHKGKKYVICDPTYIGAPVGMEMPDFNTADRSIIPLQ